MKRFTFFTLLFTVSLCGSAQGQTFNSGSTGADGAFFTPIGNVSRLPTGTQISGNCDIGCTITVPLREPPNHIFNFTTVNIYSGATVKFMPNKANTPVYILASGDVVINGTIDVRGETPQGGPGGFRGGTAQIPGAPLPYGGAGSGPGGGAPPTDYLAKTVGTSEIQPLIGGSGACCEGGGGGGAILIASSGLIDLGTRPAFAIRAEGGFGGASGGSIHLLATDLKGSAFLIATGGSTFGLPPTPSGAAGRIRLEFTRNNQYPSSGSASPTPTVNYSPFQPLVVFPPVTPTIRIVSIGGIALPAQPTAAADTPDLSLPATFTNPVSIVLEATNVPSGTLAKVIASPQYGYGDRVTSAPVALTGSVGQPKRATVAVTLPSAGAGIISAVIDSVLAEP